MLLESAAQRHTSGEASLSELAAETGVPIEVIEEHVSGQRSAGAGDNLNLVCYADESGTHDALGVELGAEVAAVVGYLSWRDDWSIFCEQWEAKLQEFHVDVFHYSDFNATRRADDPEWNYYGWSVDKKRQFINELIPIARDNTLLGIGGFVSVRDYDRLVPGWLKTATQHPYHFAFQLFFNGILHDLENKFEQPFGPDEQVAFVFDDQLEFKAKAREIFSAVKTVQDHKDRLGTITFEPDKRKHVPLQAADLLAGRLRKVVTRVISGSRVPITPGGWDDELESNHNLSMHYYDAEELQVAVRETEEIYKRLGLLR